MKTIIYYLITVILLITSCTSRENVQIIEQAEKVMDISPDSAQKELHKIKNPKSLTKYYSMKYTVLDVLAKYKLYQDVKKDTAFLDVADYFNKKSNLNDKALANYAAASILNESERYIEAMEYYKNAEKALEKTDNHLMKGIVYNNIALLYDKQLMFKEAIKYFNKSLYDFSKLSNSQSKQINNLIFLGTEYSKMKNYKYAIKCFSIAYKLSVEIKDINSQSMILNNLGIVYQEMKSYNKAIEYFSKAIDNNKSEMRSKYRSYMNLATNYLCESVFKKLDL